MSGKPTLRSGRGQEANGKYGRGWEAHPETVNGTGVPQ